MATKVKLPPNTWMDQVINLGLDKTIPFGAVNVVYNKATGAPIGFIQGNKFYKMGEKVDKSAPISSPSNPEVGFSVDDLNKKLPDGGIDPAHAHDYLNSPVPELADAAQKIIAMQSLGLWDNKGKPISIKNPSDFSAFGKIVVTQADVDKKVAEINQQKQSQANANFNDQKKANDVAKISGRAIPFPNLSQPTVTPTTAVQGFAASGQTSQTPKVTSSGTPAVTTPAPSTGKSGSLFFPTSGTGTVAKPAVTPPKTTKSPSASAGTPGNGTIPTGATWDGKKWVAPPKTPALTQADFLAKYGTTLAFINSDPSLTKLFNDASKPGAEWSAARFTLELGNTAWANRLSDSAQAEELIRLKTPSTYASSYNNMREHIASLAVSMGESLTAADIGPEIKPTGPNGTFTVADVARTEGTVTQWALDHSNDPSFANGEALQKFIATKGAINLSLPGGQAAKDNMDLKAYAGQMGMGAYALPPSGDPSKMGSDYFSAAAQSILLGKSTIDTWKSDLLQKAKDTYKAFAPSLDAGQTVQSLAAPYINTLANLLEIPTGQVDLSSTSGYGKMVHDAMIGSDPANQKPMALYDFEKLVKSQPGWGSTNNARDTIMGGVGSLLKSLGKVS